MKTNMTVVALQHWLAQTPWDEGSFSDYKAVSMSQISCTGLDVIKNTNTLILHTSRFYYSPK
jgi:hypothetical protein